MESPMEQSEKEMDVLIDEMLLDEFSTDILTGKEKKNKDEDQENQEDKAVA